MFTPVSNSSGYKKKLNNTTGWATQLNSSGFAYQPTQSSTGTKFMPHMINTSFGNIFNNIKISTGSWPLSRSFDDITGATRAGAVKTFKQYSEEIYTDEYGYSITEPTGFEYSLAEDSSHKAEGEVGMKAINANWQEALSGNDTSIHQNFWGGTLIDESFESKIVGSGKGLFTKYYKFLGKTNMEFEYGGIDAFSEIISAGEVTIDITKFSLMNTIGTLGLGLNMAFLIQGIAQNNKASIISAGAGIGLWALLALIF